MMVALPAEVYCLLGELKAAVGSFLHFPHFPHSTLPLGLLFSIHRQCFLRFQGIARTQGVPNTFMYFHIILNTWCFLHLLTLEILLTFSHFTLFIFLLYRLCCTVLMGRQQISLTWIKIPSGRVKRIWPHHTVCGGGIYIHHTGASKDIYTATTHCLNLKVTESRIFSLLLNSINQERPSRKQDKVWSPYRPCQVTHMWQTPL